MEHAVNVSATDDARSGRGARAGLEVRRTRTGRRIPTRRVMRTYQHRSACYLLSNGYHRVQPRTKRATRPKQGPNLSCAHRRAPHRAAPLLKISLAIFHCDHRNWDLGFSAIRSAVTVDSALGYAFDRSCPSIVPPRRVLIITPDDDSRHGELRSMRNGIVSVSLKPMLFSHSF